MSTSSLVAPFLRVALFDGLKPLQVTEIARNAERMIFRNGDIITRAGEEGYAAYLIVSGKLLANGLDSGNKPTALEAQQGTLISEMAMLIDGHICPATITADGPVRAFRISRAALQAQMLDDPELAEHFVGKIASRLKHLADDLRRIDAILTSQHESDFDVDEHRHMV